MKSFPITLIERRRALGLSQQQVADHLKISRQSIANYERAVQMPSLAHAIKMAKLLQFDLNEIDTDASIVEVRNFKLDAKIEAAESRLAFLKSKKEQN